MNKEIKEVKCYKDIEKGFVDCLGCKFGISISCLCDLHLMCNACCENCFGDYNE